MNNITMEVMDVEVAPRVSKSVQLTSRVLICMIKTKTFEEIRLFSLISNRYFFTLKAYLAPLKWWNLCLHQRRICLSEEPCVSSESCNHLIMSYHRPVATVLRTKLITPKAMLFRYESWFYQKPSMKNDLEVMFRHCKSLESIYINIYKDCQFSGHLLQLFQMNDKIDLRIYIRNLDENHSTLAFPRFLNRTTFGSEGFPEEEGTTAKMESRYESMEAWEKTTMYRETMVKKKKSLWDKKKKVKMDVNGLVNLVKQMSTNGGGHL